MSKRGKRQSVNRMLKRGNAEARVNYMTQNVEIWARTKRSKKFTQLLDVIQAGDAIQNAIENTEVNNGGARNS